MEEKRTAHGTGRARGRARGDRPAAAPGVSAAVPPGPSGAVGGAHLVGSSGEAPAPPGGAWAPPPQPSGAQRPAAGRGRAGRRDAQPAEGTRPEQVAPPQQVAESHAATESSGAGPQGPGRAAHRGPGVGRPGVETRLAGQMQEMSLGGGGGRKQRGALSVQYLETNFREKNMEKTGKTGDKCLLVANMFKLTEIGQSGTIFQYHVDFKPEVPSKRMRISMLSSLREALGSEKITDGMLLFLPRRLPNETSEFLVTRESDGEKIMIVVKFTNVVEPGSNTILQIYNILYRKMLQHIGLTLIQRNYFNPQGSVKVPEHKIEIWPGYATAIGLYERGIGLVADVSHKIMSLQTAWDFMTAELKRNRPMDEFKNAMLKRLVGQIVMTRYNNKTYRIDDIDWNKRPSDKFGRRDGSQQSFVEYYAAAYKLKINDPNQPLLITLPKKRDRRAGQDQPICLIPELCVITGIPEDLRSNARNMQDLARHTRIGPSDRASKLIALARQINENPHAKKEITDWNVGLDSNLATFEGRVLLREKMIMGENKEIQFDRFKVDWSREMRSAKLLAPMSLGDKQWIFVYPQDCGQLAQKIYRTLAQVGQPMGMHLAQPMILGLPQQYPNSSQYINALKANLSPATKMVLILLRSQRKDMYDALKNLLCVENPVPSQCLLEKTCNKDKAFMGVMTKVAIQMNCKMGGEVWALEIPLSQLMVVGIDTYHDSENKRRSAVGMVASLNKALTRYYTKCFLQSESEELGRGLNAGMIACLRYYQRVNGFLPTKIIIFRDGVGDGMLDTVKSYEIEQFQKSFKAVASEFKTEYNPALTVVIVKKRISTRIFRRDERGFQNPPPGTVVDDHITKPMWYDFFIVSQAVTQGTVAPTHYNVIHDGRTVNAEQMQRLTYKLCHLYYNWPGTIRVPAPCQYAHKVAFLVGQSLHREPHPSMCDTLYYL